MRKYSLQHVGFGVIPGRQQCHPHFIQGEVKNLAQSYTAQVDLGFDGPEPIK